MSDEKRTVKDRWDDFKASCQRKWDAAHVWCGENKELVVVLAPLAVAGIFDLAKTLIRAGSAKDEQSLRDDYIYDRRNGHYYRIKHIHSDRKRNRIYSEIDTRRSLGEPLNEILRDMRILK